MELRNVLASKWQNFGTVCVTDDLSSQMSNKVPVAGGGILATGLYCSVKPTEILWLYKYPEEKASIIQCGKIHLNTILLPKVQS